MYCDSNLIDINNSTTNMEMSSQQSDMETEESNNNEYDIIDELLKSKSQSIMDIYYIIDRLFNAKSKYWLISGETVTFSGADFVMNLNNNGKIIKYANAMPK